MMVQIGICTLVTALAQWLMNVCNNKMTYQIVRDIRNEAFHKIEILPLKYIDGHAYGEVVSRVIADVDQFSDGLLMGFTQLFTGVATILGTFCFMLSVNVKITVVVVLITPLSFFVANFIAKRTFSMFKIQSETRGEQTGLIDEMIGNQKVVQVFGRGEDVTERFDEINERLNRASLRATFFSSITNPSTRFINSLVYTGVGITGAFAVVRGSLTVGQLSSFLSYANQYTKPFNEISGVVTEFQNAIACAQRVFELIEEEPQIPEPEQAVVLKDIDGNVKIEDVSFSYVPEQKLIEDFNLDVKPGEYVALVGSSGAGKTTLCSLIPRFYDVTGGAVLLDGIDIRDVKLKDLRRQIGIVQQDVYLFAGTILENIRYGKPEATDEEVVNAAMAANAHEFIMSLPEGYHTDIGQRGVKLSGGQKQRLSIARVFLKNPPVLIFDEATSALDNESEKIVQHSLEMLAKDRTTFVIAHRLSTIRNAQRILVLTEDGIAEEGTHKSLLAQGGIYAGLYNMQF